MYNIHANRVVAGQLLINLCDVPNASAVPPVAVVVADGNQTPAVSLIPVLNGLFCSVCCQGNAPDLILFNVAKLLVFRRCNRAVEVVQ